eukprot:m51a1_g7241 hypothetical protein (523) ;mRNA; f:108942-110984
MGDTRNSELYLKSVVSTLAAERRQRNLEIIQEAVTESDSTALDHCFVYMAAQAGDEISEAASDAVGVQGSRELEAQALHYALEYLVQQHPPFRHAIRGRLEELCEGPVSAAELPEGSHPKTVLLRLAVSDESGDSDEDDANDGDEGEESGGDDNDGDDGSVPLELDTTSCSLVANPEVRRAVRAFADSRLPRNTLVAVTVLPESAEERAALMRAEHPSALLCLHTGGRLAVLMREHADALGAAVVASETAKTRARARVQERVSASVASERAKVQSKSAQLDLMRSEAARREQKSTADIRMLKEQLGEQSAELKDKTAELEHWQRVTARRDEQIAQFMAATELFKEQLMKKNAEINDKNAEIDAKNAEIQQKNAELSLQTAELSRQNADISQKNAEIDAKNAEIQQKNAELSRQTAELSRQNADISQKNAEIQQKSAEIQQKNAEIQQKNAEIQQKNAEIERVLDIVCPIHAVAAYYMVLDLLRDAWWRRFQNSQGRKQFQRCEADGVVHYDDDSDDDDGDLE